jgi:hypothetical protein
MMGEWPHDAYQWLNPAGDAVVRALGLVRDDWMQDWPFEIGNAKYLPSALEAFEHATDRWERAVLVEVPIACFARTGEQSSGLTREMLAADPRWEWFLARLAAAYDDYAPTILAWCGESYDPLGDHFVSLGLRSVCERTGHSWQEKAGEG